MTNEEVDSVEKMRRKINFCLFIVVLTAVIMGVLYYYGETQVETNANEGTLISSLGMELEQLLCQ